MVSNLLARLAVAGVLERTGNRLGARLRVAPRFLAHAEAVAHQQRARGRSPEAVTTLEAALARWDEYQGDCRLGADILLDFMEIRDQLGSVRPMFPALERYAVVA